LNSIISELGLVKSDCIYVGDSVFNDVAMAEDCGIDSAWAEYGQAHRREEYGLLVRVTHWSLEEVSREARIKAREHVHPTYTLQNSFAEILGYVDFRNFNGSRPKLAAEDKDRVIDIWKTIVDVQQHFNDIEMRIRSVPRDPTHHRCRNCCCHKNHCNRLVKEFDLRALRRHLNPSMSVGLSHRNEWQRTKAPDEPAQFL
jgi:hypothetical protein